MSKNKKSKKNNSNPKQSNSINKPENTEGDLPEIIDKEQACPENPEVDVNSQLDELNKKIADLEADKLKLMADQVNYTKRMNKLIEESIEDSNHKTIKDFIPVLDAINQAIKSQDWNSNNNSILEGIQLVKKEFIRILNNYSVNEVVPEIGSQFDPNFHEALAIVPGETDNSIIEIVRFGYSRDNKILRPAQVVVSKIENNKDNSSN